MDVVRRAFGQQAYRCRKCHHRFYGPKDDASTSSETPGSSKRKPLSIPSVRNSHRRKRRIRRLITIGIFALVFMLFLIFLRLITREGDSGPDSMIVKPSISLAS